MRTFTFTLLALLMAVLSDAQPQQRTTAAEYVQKYKDDAIRDMIKTGVPASITLAQGILESDAGNSDLAREANNHFGIKCHKEWTGEFFIKDDDTKDECFRKYKTALESFDDHGMFLRTRPRYAFLFDLEINDYKGWAHGLKKAGYATNPRYADILIRIIEEHELYQYDKGGRAMPIGKEQSPAADVRPQPKEPVHEPRPARHKKTKPSKVQADQSKAGYLVNENQVPYVLAGKTDSWYTIAVAHNMRMWQILKYNDADKNETLSEGEIVYLKPKRGRPSEAVHKVQQGETLRLIAQKHGVKVSKLIKLNNMNDGVSVTPGQTLKLR
jgi:LysM repeat protein